MINKKTLLAGMILLTAGITLAVSFIRMNQSNAPGIDNAEQAAKAYAYSINYEYTSPEKVYNWMTAAFKKQMSKEAFTEAFIKERSYPYLTPLYLNYDHIEMSQDMLKGKVIYSQAARLPGMIYEVSIIYEDGTYHIDDFESFLDGSYLDKFDTVTYDLSSYFDMNVIENQSQTHETGEK